MIILPDKNIPRAKFLMPVPKKEWMVPSLAQPKDQFGRENRKYFRIRAFTNDGKICWCGIYEDREDFDAVLWAIATDTLKYEKALWPLSTPSWEPWLGEIISYDFASPEKLTSPTGSNQTYNKPTDWTDAGSKIECIGAGASGAYSQQASYNTSGGGAGSYSKISNFSFTSSSATYQIGTGGIAVSGTTGSTTTSSNGNNGGNTWFNPVAASDPGFGSDNTKCSAESGKAGAFSSNGTTVNGGAGGATTASWGETKWAGGRGGNTTSVNRAGTGGGGAGGSSGAGNNGVDVNTANTGSNGGAGGAGDTGVGAAGTAGTGVNDGGSATSAGNGGNGTNLADASVGTGGGGGAMSNSSNASKTAGSGGNYGGGGGGATNYTTGQQGSMKATSGAGIGGLIIITYTPSVNNGKFLLMFG